jgi:hypothetical protein
MSKQLEGLKKKNWKATDNGEYAEIGEHVFYRTTAAVACVRVIRRRTRLDGSRWATSHLTRFRAKFTLFSRNRRLALP